MKRQKIYRNKIIFFIALFLMISCVSHGMDDVNHVSVIVEKTVYERITTRDFPSVFQAWSGIDNLPNVNFLERIAKHDLMWSCIGLGGGLQWFIKPIGLSESFEPKSIQKGQEIRKQLLRLNPNIILIAEIRYRDASVDWLPEGHKWWMRDEDGQIIKGWEEGGYLRLDYKNPEFQKHVASQAKAVIESGVVDGIMLDWWNDDEDRLSLVKEIRAAIGDSPIIIVNTNHRKAPRTASYINGLFMECYKSETANDWQVIAETLTWAEQNLRPPRVNCVEVWYENSRQDLQLMRAVTTLVLTHSNGYCLFSDPNPLPGPDHLHNWYPFWDKTLGKPLTLGSKRDDGAMTREFEKGTVIYNPMGNHTIEVIFENLRFSQATGKSGKIHTLECPDGDIYLYQPVQK